MDPINYLPITKIVNEAKDIKTFYFDYKLGSKPGQFVMLWLPGLDQKPFSIAYDDGKKFGLTIFSRGVLTKELFSCKLGDRVGISGPYGTNFSIKPKTHYIMVAGGYGAAPLAFLAEALNKSPLEGGSRGMLAPIDFLIGARSKTNLLFENRLTKLKNVKLHIATNDGSKGHKGFVTNVLADLLKSPLLTKDGAGGGLLVATCGPELMEYEILKICNQRNLACEISIERFIKCGTGVCGQCCVDPLGIRMCKEGPVVNRELANKITEFGKYHRDKSGKKASF